MGVFVLFGLNAFAGEPKQWNTATVLDAGTTKQYAGSSQTEGYDPYRQRGLKSPYPASSTSTARYRTAWTITLDAGEYIYVAQGSKAWIWSKAPIVTINGAVKYMLDGKRGIRIQDDDGKEHRLEIAKRILKKNSKPPDNKKQVNDVR